MEIDGPVIVWYVVNGIALLAILALIIMHFSGERSGIDWTLFQIYVLAGLSIISLMPPSLIYGARVPQLVPIRGDLCVMQAQLSHFFLLALRMFPILLCFELWWVVVKRRNEATNRFGLFGSMIIYLFCIGVTAAEIVLEFNAPGMGVTPLRFYCSLQYDSVYSLTMEVPSITCAAIGLGFTIHSTIHLYKTFREFQKHPNRKLHIRRSLTVRLCIWAVVYTLISGVLAVNNLVLMVHNETGLTPREYNQPILEFAAAGSALVLLAIFGTTKKAAIFLPCFTLPSEMSRSKKANSWDYQTESQRGLTSSEPWQQTSSIESWPRSRTPESVMSLPPPRVNLTDSKVFEPSFTVEDIKFHRQSMDASPRAQSPGPNPFMARSKNAVAVARAPEMEVMAKQTQMSSMSQDVSRHQQNSSYASLPRQDTSASLTSVTLPPRIEPRMPNDSIPQPQYAPPHAEPLRPIEPVRPVMFRPPGYLESRFSWDSNTPSTPRR